eukprot:Anaeramoba_flamelloidesc36117_g1_i1.p1 GENE.c36117_g1_i1~~c36117_g1_i1.p1  ORF type:complete len:340 (+),score=93.62 c36117_g1_i1:129-1148(+)
MSQVPTTTFRMTKLIASRQLKQKKNSSTTSVQNTKNKIPVANGNGSTTENITDLQLVDQYNSETKKGVSRKSTSGNEQNDSNQVESPDLDKEQEAEPNNFLTNSTKENEKQTKREQERLRKYNDRNRRDNNKKFQKRSYPPRRPNNEDYHNFRRYGRHPNRQYNRRDYPQYQDYHGRNNLHPKDFYYNQNQPYRDNDFNRNFNNRKFQSTSEKSSRNYYDEKKRSNKKEKQNNIFGKGNPRDEKKWQEEKMKRIKNKEIVDGNKEDMGMKGVKKVGKERKREKVEEEKAFNPKVKIRKKKNIDQEEQKKSGGKIKKLTKSSKSKNKDSKTVKKKKKSLK